jgi:hypothetical protein
MCINGKLSERNWLVFPPIDIIQLPLLLVKHIHTLTHTTKNLAVLGTQLIIDKSFFSVISEMHEEC